MTSQQEPAESDIGREIEARVKAYAEAALDALPVEYARRVENVQFFIRRTVTPEERQRMRLGRGDLYGLYEGIPLTHRTSGYNHVTPDRITLFWGPLVRDYPTDEALADKVAKVVYHEIAHYFGMSESDLAHTSVK